MWCRANVSGHLYQREVSRSYTYLIASYYEGANALSILERWAFLEGGLAALRPQNLHSIVSKHVVLYE